MNGIIAAIYISPAAGEPMQSVDEVEAIAGQGLKGDRYATGNGSWNRGKQSKRQVTLINGIFFRDNKFIYPQSRRNIITMDIELMALIGHEFDIGRARFRGVKYCEPCPRPSTLCGSSDNFKEVFFDRGGLVAEVIQSGLIEVNDFIVPPK